MFSTNYEKAWRITASVPFLFNPANNGNGIPLQSMGTDRKNEVAY